MRILAHTLLLIAFVAGPAFAQSSPNALPKAVFAAKTIALINDTHTDAVADGAIEQLKDRKSVV